MASKKHAPENNINSPRYDELKFPRNSEPLDFIAEALKGLQYGQITVLVQDGVVIQIERTEKRRLK